MRYLAVLALFLVALTPTACGSSNKAPATSTTSSPPTTNVPAKAGPLSEEEFKALHTPPAENKTLLHGEMIDLDGTKAYLSLPAGKGPFPGIVVIHEWWGLNDNIKHWSDRLATAGYAAIAVDLYGGRILTTSDEALKAVKSVKPPEALAIIKRGFDFLGSDPRIMAPKRAVIGWCFGGAYALAAALAMPQLDGVIEYYGDTETDPEKLKAIKGRLLAIFGTRDKSLPPEQVAKFEAALKQAGVRAEIHSYDAEHAFANPSNSKYDEKASADAWSHVLAFLNSLKS
jgi:carboxymethylenebutenolidase